MAQDVVADEAGTEAEPAAAEIDWHSLIAATLTAPRAKVRAETFLLRRSSNAQPVDVQCDDGNEYVIKCLQTARADDEMGRIMFNDHVAGRLGALMSAPVPTVGLVDVTSELIALNSAPDKMGHLKACTAHGSLKLDDMVDNNSFDHADEGDNRQRYCRLAIFNGWLVHGDRQFIKSKQPPHTVYSHDHGHFFPGGPPWSQASLAGHTQPAVADPDIVNNLALTANELRESSTALASITPEMVAGAIAAPPVEWNVSLEDRVALAKFLHRRQRELLTTYAGPVQSDTPP